MVMFVFLWLHATVDLLQLVMLDTHMLPFTFCPMHLRFLHWNLITFAVTKQGKKYKDKKITATIW